MILATDWASGQPGGGETGKGSQAGGGGGPWHDGFKTLKGDWEPDGFRVIEFDTEDAAVTWFNSTEGTTWAKKYDNIILLRVYA